MTSILEKEKVVGDIEYNEMVAHLYPVFMLSDPIVTYCGIHKSKDPHNTYHLNVGHRGAIYNGERTCPSCGATICPDCEAAVVLKPK